MTDIRTTEIHDDATWEETHAYARGGCPGPHWSVVTIEQRHPQYGLTWTAYAEPGQSETDTASRLRNRVTARAEDVRIALKLLGDELRRQYP